MTFNPCEDCGSPIWPLVVAVVVIWSVPALLLALRIHVAPDRGHETAIGEIQVGVTVVAGLITAWLVIQGD